MSGLLSTIVQAAKEGIDGVPVHAGMNEIKADDVNEADAIENEVKGIVEAMNPVTETLKEQSKDEAKVDPMEEGTEEVKGEVKEYVALGPKEEITEGEKEVITEETKEVITDGATEGILTELKEEIPTGLKEEMYEAAKTETLLDEVDSEPNEDWDNKRKADDTTEDKPFKKAKSDHATSKEGPMGELRPTDILAGNYRKRAGNFLYKKLLRENAPDVGKVEMRTIVAKVVDAIHAQDPPGRFIREGGDSILSRAQTNQKVARALREVHERSQKEGEVKGEGVEGKPVTKKAGRASDKHEPMGELRPTDVLTGNYRKRPGNFLYKKLLRENAPAVGKEEMRAVVNRVIDGITSQNPPGRFIREGGGGLLTRGQTHQKVARALREVMERSTGDGKQAAEKAAKKAKAATETKDEPMGEIRPTDVLTGNYRKRPGNFLFKKLLRENAPFVGKEEMSIVVARVIDAITAQEPPGRFIREGGSSLLTKGQTRQKVARALREVVERTKNPEKDKNKPPAITAAEAIAADKARRDAALLRVAQEQAEAAVNLLTEQTIQVPVKEDLPTTVPENIMPEEEPAKVNPVENEAGKEIDPQVPVTKMELDQPVPVAEEPMKPTDQQVPDAKEPEKEGDQAVPDAKEAEKDGPAKIETEEAEEQTNGPLKAEELTEEAPTQSMKSSRPAEAVEEAENPAKKTRGTK